MKKLSFGGSPSFKIGKPDAAPITFGPGAGVPVPPAGYSYLTDQRTNNLTTQNGVMLIARTY